MSEKEIKIYENTHNPLHNEYHQLQINILITFCGFCA
jgi:hypothetical protein